MFSVICKLGTYIRLTFEIYVILADFADSKYFWCHNLGNDIYLLSTVLYFIPSITHGKVMFTLEGRSIPNLHILCTGL